MEDEKKRRHLEGREGGSLRTMPDDEGQWRIIVVVVLQGVLRRRTSGDGGDQRSEGEEKLKVLGERHDQMNVPKKGA